jgi:hypothetical protein
MHFSPSYGVRAGFIKDPNWPPAKMSEDGTSAQRRHLRVKCGFTVRTASGESVETKGDVSAGGAKFSVRSPLGNDVEVLAGGVAARANVLQVLKGAGQHTYRVQFVDPKAGAELFEAVYWQS